MAIDENFEHDNEAINFYKRPKDGQHKIHDKKSGSYSDSEYVLANIRNKQNTNKPKHGNSKLMKDYMTYNAINFDYKKDKAKNSSKSREKLSSLSSRSVPKGSSSVTESDKKLKSSQIQKNKSFNNPAKLEYDKITVTSIVPSTINSVLKERKTMVSKNSSKSSRIISAKSHAEKVRSRQTRTSSEERNLDLKFSADMRDLFYPSNGSRLKETDRPITSLDQYASRVTLISKNDSPLKNQSINRAISTQKLYKIANNKEENFTFGYKTENKPSSSTLSKKILKQYMNPATLSSPSNSTTRDKYQSYEHRRQLSKQNKKQLIKKMIRSPMNNVLSKPNSIIKPTSKVTASHNLSILHKSSTLRSKYINQSSFKTNTSRIINKSNLINRDNISRDGSKNNSKVKKYTRLSNFDKSIGCLYSLI